MIKKLDDPFYYLANFQHVLAWIGDRYQDLLSEDERAFIGCFPALPQPSKALLVRMIMRKGSLFRTSKLAYDEIGDIQAAVAPLVGKGWVDSDPPITQGGHPVAVRDMGNTVRRSAGNRAGLPACRPLI